MGIPHEIDERYKEAMKARDARTVSALRMAKARMKQHQIDARVGGELSDDDARQVLATYVKQLHKAIPEFEKAGEAGREKVADLRFEISVLEPYLPHFLDEAATRAIVTQVVTDLGKPPLQRSGMVIGQIMKAHKGQVDPALVRKLVEEALGA
ncbi:MAG: GatB/YqeY domain-containing protein [Candidatus Eisenbacteria bacterium]|nr:GatB/YqeY domain-containing protein [Candidatus Eisenbacteria bacterium]